MKVSLNTLKQFTPVDVPLDELTSKINQQLGGVERVYDLGARYDGAVVVRVESCEKHENADKLNVCQVDDGSGALTQVVCGAPNVHAGMYAVWLKPGSTVPSTADDAEPFVLGARELRGIMSNGMLASPKELGLGDSHDGILELTEHDVVEGKALTAGAGFAELFGLNDSIIEIENKMFTHRPDLFGQIGVAREVAGITQQRFESPDWYDAGVTTPLSGEGTNLHTFNEAGVAVPRITFVAIDGVSIRPSPVWLQCALVALGGKPINNVVDVTNYIMLLTAQPTHAYDYDSLRGGTIGARMAKAGESVRLLNSKTYALQQGDIVIADAEGPIGLGGIMGGAESEVTAQTTTIVLEVATFDMYAVRKSSMRHGIFTDALTRFNKGQSPLQNRVVLSQLASLIQSVAGGTISSEVFDSAPSLNATRQAVVHPDFINQRLGLDLTKQSIETMLSNVEFEICVSCSSDEHTDGSVHYAIPFWRTDIDLPEDIVEEIGRLNGFESLPRELPRRSAKAAAKNQQLESKRVIRELMTSRGASEVLTYSFVHEKLLTKAGQSTEHAYRLSNALSPDLQFYRLSLVPSLLDKVRLNVKAGYDAFALYEFGKVHFKGDMSPDEPAVPNEDRHMAFVVAQDSKHAPKSAPFYMAKRYADGILNLADYDLVALADFDVSNDLRGRQLVAPYEPGRSAVLVRDNRIYGVIGEFRTEVRRSFKLPDYVAGFEIHADALVTDKAPYRPLSKFPSVTQDVSIRAAQADFADVESVVHEVLSAQADSLHIDVSPLAIYQPEEGREITTTFRLTVTNTQATLTDAEVRPIIESIGALAGQRFDGRVV